MFNSKALKPFDDDEPKTKLGKFLSEMRMAFYEFEYSDVWWKEWIYNTVKFIQDWTYYNPYGFFENLKRVYAYGKLGWNNYDWEGHYLYKVMQFKLKRMQHELTHNSHAIPNQHNEMKALALAIKLGDRLYDDYQSYHHFHDLHNKKWGEAEMKSVPCTWDENGKPRSYSVDFSRANARTNEEKKQERKEFLEAVNKDERRKIRDREIYFKILAKYLPYMWD